MPIVLVESLDLVIARLARKLRGTDVGEGWEGWEGDVLDVGERL